MLLKNTVIQFGVQWTHLIEWNSKTFKSISEILYETLKVLVANDVLAF